MVKKDRTFPTLLYLNNQSNNKYVVSLGAACFGQAKISIISVIIAFDTSGSYISVFMEGNGLDIIARITSAIAVSRGIHSDAKTIVDELVSQLGAKFGFI